jgi:hypothetical protein
LKLDLEFPGWTKRETEDAFHIWPELDRIDHDPSPNCPCDPLLEFQDAETDKEVWIHFGECSQPVARR